MTAPAPIIDPDLEDAIEALRFTERRLRDVEQHLLEAAPEKYQFRMQMIHERADLREQIKIRADKLNLDPRALALIIREADKVRSKQRGRQTVPLGKLLTVISTVAEYARIERAEAHAEMLAAQERAGAATHRSVGLAKAVEYLEACRAG